MLIRERKKEEIQARAGKMAEFLKMQYFEECVKKSEREIDLEARKFCHAELIRIYGERGMYKMAALHSRALAELAITFKEKINHYVKEAEFWIKAEKYQEADKALINAVQNTTSIEKKEVIKNMKEIYQKEAENYEKTNKPNKALKIYEKLYNEEPAGKEKLKEKIDFLHGKFGKCQEPYSKEVVP